MSWLKEDSAEVRSEEFGNSLDKASDNARKVLIEATQDAKADQLSSKEVHAKQMEAEVQYIGAASRLISLLKEIEKAPKRFGKVKDVSTIFIVAKFLKRIAEGRLDEIK